MSVSVSTQPSPLDSKARAEAQAASDREETIKRDQRRDLAAVLKTPEGRRVMWRLLEHTNVFGSCWEDESDAHRARRIARQDVGHFLMDEIQGADINALFLMMTENKKGD